MEFLAQGRCAVLGAKSAPLSQATPFDSVEDMDMENIANRIRQACVEAALQAYEDAGMQGLCEEGRWEAAVSALRTVDLVPMLRDLRQAAANNS
jgi:hypothetical protein